MFDKEQAKAATAIAVSRRKIRRPLEPLKVSKLERKRPKRRLPPTSATSRGFERGQCCGVALHQTMGLLSSGVEIATALCRKGSMERAVPTVLVIASDGRWKSKGKSRRNARGCQVTVVM